MSEGDCVQAATVNRRAKYTRHSNPSVQLFIGRGMAAFIADIIRSSGSWDGMGNAQNAPCGTWRRKGHRHSQWQRQMTYNAGTGGAANGRDQRYHQ
jgi:hypothetical protein